MKATGKSIIRVEVGRLQTSRIDMALSLSHVLNMYCIVSMILWANSNPFLKSIIICTDCFTNKIYIKRHYIHFHFISKITIFLTSSIM